MRWPWSKQKAQEEGDSMDLNETQDTGADVQDSGASGSGEQVQQPDPREEEFRLMKEEIGELRTLVKHYTSNQQGQAQAQPAKVEEPKPDFRYYSTRDIAKATAEQDYELAEEMRAHNARTSIQEEKYGLNKTLNEIKSYGTKALGDINLNLAKNKFQHLDIPEVEKAFQAQVKQMEQLGQPLNDAGYEWMYNQAVGAHADKVFSKLEKQKGAELRNQHQSSGDVSPTGKGGRSSGAMGDDEVPPPEVELGAGALVALRQAGLTPDDEARRRGYKDYKDWAKARAKQRAA